MNKGIVLRNRQAIESRIFTIRGVHVMLDSDLAAMYDVETKNLNKATKRNSGRFPPSLMFRLTEVEYETLRFQIGTSKSKRGGRRYLPYVFTEQGVANAFGFVEMRKTLIVHSGLFQRMDRFEVVQTDHGQKIEQIFQALESGSVSKKQGIFFDGQIFDAYKFSADLVRSARHSIQLIDNYVDDSVLMLLSKRKKGVTATIYTKTISKLLEQDLRQHNSQYPLIEIKHLYKAHDRFLIIDKNVYHIGASLKDLGKKWFAFSLIEKDALGILERLEQL